MLSISPDTKIILGIIAAIATILSAAIGNVLAINIVYFFTRRGRRPTVRPTRLWVIFYFSAAISVVVGSIAAFAPVLPDVTSAPLYSSNNIRLVPTDDQNIVVKLGSQPLSPDDVVPLGETITVIFKILNNGTSSVTIKALVIGSRGPGVTCENTNAEKWLAPDNPFPTPANIIIQPGQQYEYRGSRAFYIPGKYFLEPIIQGPNGNWGGIQPFSCISITVDGTQPSLTKTPTLAATFDASPTPSSSPTPTPTPIMLELSVFAAQYPFDSMGITVKEGDKVTIVAVGEWDCGRGSLIGPEGYTIEQYSDHVFSNAPACALIGAITSIPPTETFDQYFLVGAKRTWIAQETGKLYLGCNDAINSFDNPTDSKLEVKIIVEKQINQ